MGKTVNHIGEKFGRLLIVTQFYKTNKGNGRNKSYITALCDCGSLREYNLSNVKGGKSVSCGCFARESTSVRNKQNVKHGHSYNPLWHVWHGMIDRCNNEVNRAYENYGGRGISVCSEWVGDVAAFVKWGEANGYVRNVGLELDRINNDGNYKPGNCRFVTPTENCRNKRNNRWYVLNGDRKILKDWATHFKISYKLLHKHITYKGKSFEEAIEKLARA